MIPVSQEYDPGKNVDSTRAHPPVGLAIPYGYLYPLDLSRIHRLLRPIKAKIAAIRLAIKTAPSFGYASAIATSSSIADNTSDSEEQSEELNTSILHPQSARLRNGNARSIRARDAQSRHSHSAAALQRQRDSNDLTMSTNQSGEQSGAEILLKRFQSSLVDQFKDVVEKVWWQPFCEDYGLPINTSPASAAAMVLQPASATLGVTCAFTVGRIVACLPEDDVSTMETYYGIMPAYMRRFAVLEHLSELCLTQIPINQLLEPLVGICTRYKADVQTLRLLEHLLTSQDNSYQLDYNWAYHHALQIGCGDAWVETLCRSSPAAFFTAGSFQSFIRQVAPNHRALLIKASFDIHMDEFVYSISERTRRSRTSHWTSMLIEDSFRSHEQQSENSAPDQGPCVNGCDDVIDYMAKELFMPSDLYTDGDVLKWYHMGLKEVALGLALHSLYIAVTESSESVESSKENTRVDEWIRILKGSASSDIRLADFDVVVKAYCTLTQLNALALILDAVGLYSLSMRLINRMLRDFYTLEKTSRKRLGHSCNVTKSGLQAHLREVEQRRIEYADKDGWRYDEFLGDWVKQTPVAMKTGLALNDEFLTSDNDDDDFDLRTPTKSRTHGRYNISFNLGSRKHNIMGPRNDGFDDFTEDDDQDTQPKLDSDVIVLSDTTDYGGISNDTRSDHYSEEDDEVEEEEEEEVVEEEEERYDSGLEQHDRASESEFAGGSSEEDVQDHQPVLSIRSKRRRTPSPFPPPSQLTRTTRGSLAKKRAKSYLAENATQISSDDDSMVSEYEGSRSVLRSRTRPNTRSTRVSQAGPFNLGSVSKSATLSRRSQRLYHVASKRDNTGSISDDAIVDEQDDEQGYDTTGVEDTVEYEDASESAASDRFAEEENQILDEHYNDYHSYSGEELYDGEDDAESDEDVTANFYKEQLASHVGAPLPLTEPDELAFWI